VRAWTETKGWVVDAIGLEPDLLHIPFGLLIFLTLAVLFRRHKDALFIALLGLTGVQVLNEVLDGVQWRIWTGGVSWMEAVEDTALTIALPLVITAAVAFMKSRRERVAERVSMHSASSDEPSDEDVGKPREP